MISRISDQKFTVITSVVVILLGVITSVLITRALTMEARGSLAEYLVYSSFVTFTFIYSLEEVIVKKLKKRYKEIRIIFRSLVLIIVSQLVFFVFLAVLNSLVQAVDATLVFLVSLLVLSSVARMWLGAIILGCVSSKKWNYSRLLQPFLYASILALYIVSGHGLNVFKVLLSFSLSNIFCIAFMFVGLPVLGRGLEMNCPADLIASIKSLMFEGSKLIGGKIASQISVRLDLVAVAYLLSPKETGIYAVAAGIALAPSGLVASQSKMVFSKLAGSEDAGIIRAFKQRFFAFWVFVAVSVALAVAIMPTLITFLYGSLYIDSVLPAQIIISSAVVYSLRMFLSSYVISKLEPIYATYSEIFALALSFALVVPLINNYGLVGAAGLISINCMASLLFLMGYVYSSRRPSEGKGAQ